MEITRLRVRNFRSIKALDLDLGNNTVLVGPNNAGKTAILDAMRIALGRRWGKRGTGFTEYDIHLADEKADPKSSGPAVIELQFKERHSGEWPQELQDDLLDEINTDSGNRSYITLRVSCGWDSTKEAYEPEWHFLDASGAPKRGARQRVTNTHPLFNYAPIFYMSALRDSEGEFSPQSQFWGRLLKAVSVPPGIELKVMRILERVNSVLMKSDPKLAQITGELKRMTSIAAQDTTGDLQLRALPHRIWDLISRSELIMRTQADSPWFPLLRHGQGMQSLSVIFLFEVFVKQLLAEIYGQGAVPILALEEPEAHLHPQAVRTMWAHINELPGQKIITTHSPYLVQAAPFRSLRIVRCGLRGTEVFSLSASFSTGGVPHSSEIAAVISKYPGKLAHDAASGELTSIGRMDEATKRDLLTAVGSHPKRAEIVPLISACHAQSQRFVDAATLNKLDDWARRIRGEIFFARKWLLVEGQSEYVLIHGLAKLLGYDLDQHGVSVIDYRNNGSLGPFVALARAFQIPWITLVDSDQQGRASKAEVVALGVPTPEITARLFATEEKDLEASLLSSPIEATVRDVLEKECGVMAATTLDRASVAAEAEKRKVELAVAMVERVRANPPLVAQMPASVKSVIDALRGLT